MPQKKIPHVVNFDYQVDIAGHHRKRVEELEDRDNTDQFTGKDEKWHP